MLLNGIVESGLLRLSGSSIKRNTGRDNQKNIGLVGRPPLTRLSLLVSIQVTIDTANTREYEGCTPTEQNHSVDSLYTT